MEPSSPPIPSAPPRSDRPAIQSSRRHKPRWPVWLRRVVHLLAAAPLVWLATRFLLLDGLGANPIETAIRFLGDQALRLLILSLAITPLRVWGQRPDIAPLRRPLGLWAFAYALLHLLLWLSIDQEWDGAAIVREIVKRKFLTFGMLSVSLLLPLALTSTQAMIRRLGGLRWKRLHKLAYPAALLAATHYIMMVKGGPTLASLHLAVLLVLLLLRLPALVRLRRLS